MDSKELKLVSEKAECLHSAAVIQGPDGLRTYGLPVDADQCLQCAWRAFEQSWGKNKELPSVQIFYWAHSDDKEPHWVVEAFPESEDAGIVSFIGRGATPGQALFDLSREITSSLRDQRP
jgi:hypothetical protein